MALMMPPPRVTLGGAAGSIGRDPYVRGARRLAGSAGEALGGVARLLGEEMMPFPRTKEEDRLERADHAAVTAQTARVDPSAGTKQGASQAYQGTGDTKTQTVKSGGVTTGAPGGSLSISVPGRGMVDYDPDDPSVREAFTQQRGGKPDFMLHRERTTRQPAMERGDPTLSVGPPGAATGRPSWTESAVPEAAQIANWDAFVKGREAEQATFETGMAETRARGVEASMRAEHPFYAQELQAKGKLAEAAVKAETEGAQRAQIMNIVNGAAQQLNALREQPRYRALTPEQQREIEDQVWDQARLTLSALTRTNLYPRPDPYAALLGLTPPAPTATPEGTQ